MSNSNPKSLAFVFVQCQTISIYLYLQLILSSSLPDVQGKNKTSTTIGNDFVYVLFLSVWCIWKSKNTFKNFISFGSLNTLKKIFWIVTAYFIRNLFNPQCLRPKTVVVCLEAQMLQTLPPQALIAKQICVQKNITCILILFIPNLETNFISKYQTLRYPNFARETIPSTATYSLKGRKLLKYTN